MKMSVIIDADRPRKDGSCAVKIRISQKGKFADVPLNFSVLPQEFDGRLPKYPAHRKMAEDTLARYHVRLLELGTKVELMSAVQIRDWLTEKKESRRLLLADAIWDYSARCSREKTRESYTYTRDKVLAFSGAEPLQFEDVDYKWLTAFDRFMERNGIGTNSRSIVFRCLRAVFNDAIDNDLTETYPFRKFTIKKEETRKRSLTAEQLATLRGEIERNINRMNDVTKMLAQNYPKAFRHALTVKSIRMLLTYERRTIRKLQNDGVISEKDAERLIEKVDERTDEGNSFRYTVLGTLLRGIVHGAKKKGTEKQTPTEP